MPSEPSEPRDVESLLVEYLSARSRGEALELEAWLAGHPEHADELRQAWADQREAAAALDAEDGARPTPYRALVEGGELGDFLLVRRLGSGAQGTVWEAGQRSLDRRVALKIVNPERVNEHAIALLEREARAGGRLSHPGIVAVYGRGETEGVHWIAQELVPQGRTLRDLLDELRAAEALPADHDARVAEIAARVADALHTAHEAGVLHRDVKPLNVLLAPDGQPKLTDFGLARIAEESRLSGSSEVVGTYVYMSPEQIGGRRGELDRRSDVFSLGILFYELLTLERPFRGDTPAQVGLQILSSEPPDPRRARSRIPHDLVLICAKALQKAPQRRYANAAELAADLRRHLAHEPIHARPTSAGHRAVKLARRHPTATIAAAILTVALPLLGSLAAYVALTRDEVQAAEAARRAERLELHVLQGYQALAHGDARARDSFEAALKLKPSTPEAIAGWALSCTLSGYPDTSLKFLEDWRRTAGATPASMVFVEADALRIKGKLKAAEALEASVAEMTNALDFYLRGAVYLTRAHEADTSESYPDQSLYRLAADDLEQAIFRSPRAQALYYCQYAHAVGHLNDPDAAERILEPLEGLWPDSSEVQRWAGFLLQRTGDPRRAIEYFERALALDPGMAPAHVDIARSWTAIGELERAEAALNKAVAADPRHVGALLDLSHALRMRGAHEDALEVAHVALDLTQDLRTLGAFRVRSRLAQIYGDLGDVDAALSMHHECIRLRPDAGAPRYDAGTLLMHAGRTEDALTLLFEAVSLDPRQSGHLNNLGTALAGVGRLQEAELMYREAIRLEPTDPQAHSNLGVVLDQQGKGGEARFELCEGVERSTVDNYYVESRLNYCQMLQMVGELDHALELGLEAHRHRPDDEVALNSLTYIYFRLSRLEECVELCGEWIELGGSSYRANLVMAASFIDFGLFEHAVPPLERALEEMPGSPEARGRLGPVMTALGRHEEALVLLDGLQLITLSGGTGVEQGVASRVTAARHALRAISKVDLQSRVDPSAHARWLGSCALRVLREQLGEWVELRDAGNINPSDLSLGLSLILDNAVLRSSQGPELGGVWDYELHAGWEEFWSETQDLKRALKKD